mmetsp:Transcript_13444/g.19634  ORF Transcript_13444/g.19634 Transcript_13444/m.19634 type:complete len:272 (+) Transcript_13444:1420-2235(+)
MGCCQARDSSPGGMTTLKTKLQDTTQEYPELGVVTKASIETYFQTQQWELLAGCISCTETLATETTYPKWTAKPKTLGALAVAYLCKACKRSEVARMACFPYLDSLLGFLEVGSQDLREITVGLLQHCVKTPKLKARLLRLGVFSRLVECLNFPSFDLRHKTAALAEELYKGNLPAQEKFIQQGGVAALVRAIAVVSLRGKSFQKLTQCLVSLMKDADGNPVQNHLEVVYENLNWELIEGINPTLMNDSVRKTFDNFLILLSCRKTAIIDN